MSSGPTWRRRSIAPSMSTHQKSACSPSRNRSTPASMLDLGTTLGQFRELIVCQAAEQADSPKFVGAHHIAARSLMRSAFGMASPPATRRGWRDGWTSATDYIHAAEDPRRLRMVSVTLVRNDGLQRLLPAYQLPRTGRSACNRPGSRHSCRALRVGREPTFRNVDHAT